MGGGGGAGEDTLQGWSVQGWSRVEGVYGGYGAVPTHLQRGPVLHQVLCDQPPYLVLLGRHRTDARLGQRGRPVHHHVAVRHVDHAVTKRTRHVWVDERCNAQRSPPPIHRKHFAFVVKSVTWADLILKFSVQVTYWDAIAILTIYSWQLVRFIR